MWKPSCLISFPAVCLIVYTNAQDVDPGEFKDYVKATVTDDKIKITDREGKPISDVIVNDETGYQVELPADQKTCLVRKADDKSDCYSEELVSEALPDDVLLRCEGRAVAMLRPVACDEEGKGEAETELLPWCPKRPIWSRCCRWRYRVTVRCMHGGRPCRYWHILIIWTRFCNSGYTRPFFPICI